MSFQYLLKNKVANWMYILLKMLSWYLTIIFGHKNVLLCNKQTKSRKCILQNEQYFF